MPRCNLLPIYSEVVHWSFKRIYITFAACAKHIYKKYVKICSTWTVQYVHTYAQKLLFAPQSRGSLWLAQ